ncbi:hypothetical protein FHS57_006429 [Runella defluvii]|uniref:Lipocalin-like domain-containing protein n=1 Tax=Runella defluvii TaxID=370973 RepID=A0A7W6EU37_9BACT|nr:hypothetical protein [Runella defluvii]MBB3842398.1 hypothetical protein [Runella defluvii]
MNIFKVVLILTACTFFFSCDRDRERIKAEEGKLEGSWKFVSMEYKDSKGQPVVITPQESGTPPSVVLTLIGADRTGVLRIDDTYHNFIYLYGGGKCDFTFEKKGTLSVEAVGLPAESIGKVFIYNYNFTTADHNTVIFKSDKEYLKTKNEIITNVQYTYTKL